MTKPKLLPLAAPLEALDAAYKATFVEPPFSTEEKRLRDLANDAPLQYLSTATLWAVVRRNPSGKLPQAAEQELNRELAIRRQQERRK